MRVLSSRPKQSSVAQRRSLVRSLLVIFAAVMVIVTSMVLTALDRVGEHANRLDDERSRETTIGALLTFRNHLGATLNDYAAWDDADRYVYADDGMDWVISNFGEMTANNNLFDAAVVLNAEGHALMTYEGGEPADWAIKSYFDPSFATLFDGVRNSAPEAMPEGNAFIRTPRGIAAVAIGLVRQKSGRIDHEPADRRYLVLLRHLHENEITAMARTYVVSGLSLVGNGERRANHVEIRDADGNPIGGLTWTSRLPGSASLQQVQPLVLGAVAMVAIYFVLLFVSGARLLRQIKAEEAAAVELSRLDTLSGLSNRYGLFANLRDLVSLAQNGNDDVLLLYLDLDGFKEVNDAYGHGTGDNLIRGVSAGLLALIGREATIARVGGDEFAIAMNTRAQETVVPELCERILGFFAEPFVIGERVAVVGTSIGVAVSARGSVSGEELLRRADMAMYQSKDAGRGRWTVYSPCMDAEREERNQLEIDLRRAIENSEIGVVYQPVVDARDGRMVSVEALARWNRPGHGPVSPEIFIGVAEQTGMIDQLGLSVLRTACRAVRQWPDLRLAVNISPGQFRDPAFAGHVARTFRDIDVDPNRITLEMTESYFIRNPARALAAIDSLKAIGVKIALDDFGSGFSSVGYLRQFGFDRMKIDQSLVATVAEGGSAVDLLQATVALARALDIPVTAEGVETEDQAKILRLSGCDELQGYFFGRPMPGDAIGRMVMEQREVGG
ncbi:diguanylate cyclase (GGDEF)-like protein [Neorhizobium huautlense]|uniref:Diguanylate cyclase (GGDEF)-like protein n=1 Tax=Neorhizobium huautlense TaxID=67774 RepID=A0ABT9PPK2_9HYPH|nr:bifunctional diguanylate cyclase/phosphodiesterase [Neorhizobium huautlense]MDP9836058.1 diguanylate cyclase (GGDEF)-like protein [Neorhizobium huautlense]